MGNASCTLSDTWKGRTNKFPFTAVFNMRHGRLSASSSWDSTRVPCLFHDEMGCWKGQGRQPSAQITSTPRRRPR